MVTLSLMSAEQNCDPRPTTRNSNTYLMTHIQVILWFTNVPDSTEVPLWGNKKENKIQGYHYLIVSGLKSPGDLLLFKRSTPTICVVYCKFKVNKQCCVTFKFTGLDYQIILKHMGCQAEQIQQHLHLNGHVLLIVSTTSSIILGKEEKPG